MEFYLAVRRHTNYPPQFNEDVNKLTSWQQHKHRAYAERRSCGSERCSCLSQTLVHNNRTTEAFKFGFDDGGNIHIQFL